jgi:LemA protein
MIKSLIIVGVLAFIVIVIYNRFIRLRFLLKEAWSGIDVQLKRRHDVIPNIVNTVKGYARHERGLFEEITRLRSQVSGIARTKDRAALETDLSRFLKKLLVVVEAYPDLKASQSFLKLQETLSSIEDNLQMARRYYNGTVRNYNIAVESFPGNIIAALFSFKPADFFEIEYATERKVPDVDFKA